MSRTAASDVFTRFTSTSPHASSNPIPRSSPSRLHPTFGANPPSSSSPSKRPPIIPSAPPNETPQEKVARLRAASRLAKSRAALSPLDRIIDGGRRFADNTHRFVAYGLIGFSGIAAVLSVYAMTDLILHNRRQKRAWIDREIQRLLDARKAFIRGDPTPEQLHLLQQERAGDEIAERIEREKDRKKRESWWGRGMAVIGFGPGVKGKEATIEDAARFGRVESAKVDVETVQVVPGERLLEQERWVRESSDQKNDGQSITEKAKDMLGFKRESAADRAKQGATSAPASTAEPLAGPLDVQAGNLTGAVTEKSGTATMTATAPTTKSWFNWGKGSES